MLLCVSVSLWLMFAKKFLTTETQRLHRETDLTLDKEHGKQH